MLFLHTETNLSMFLKQVRIYMPVKLSPQHLSLFCEQSKCCDSLKALVLWRSVNREQIQAGNGLSWFTEVRSRL